MNLIDDIQHFWRFWSVRLGLLGTACGTAAATLGDIGPAWLHTSLIIGSAAFGALAVLVRPIKQAKLHPTV